MRKSEIYKDFAVSGRSKENHAKTSLTRRGGGGVYNGHHKKRFLPPYKLRIISPLKRDCFKRKIHFPTIGFQGTC